MLRLALKHLDACAMGQRTHLSRSGCRIDVYGVLIRLQIHRIMIPHKQYEALVKIEAVRFISWENILNLKSQYFFNEKRLTLKVIVRLMSCHPPLQPPPPQPPPPPHAPQRNTGYAASEEAVFCFAPKRSSFSMSS